MGLLDGIANLAFLEAIEEERSQQSYAAGRIAAIYGVSTETAISWLIADDAAAIQQFAVGNDVPRDWLQS